MRIALIVSILLGDVDITIAGASDSRLLRGTNAKPPRSLQSNTLYFLGNELPPDSYGLCEGDCDSDGDCQGDLVCFQRGGFEAVPGCLGEGTKRTDYCYDPLSTLAPVPKPTFLPTRSPLVPTVIEPRPLEDVGNNGSPAEMFPLDACHGDCDSDSECQDGLVCFQRGGLQSVPGCLGEGTSGKDYCFDPLTTPSPVASTARPTRSPLVPTVIEPRPLEDVGNNGSPAEMFPLDACLGDCDSDSECQDGLVCFQRGGLQSVPGCLGEGTSGKDYCFDPLTTPSPTRIPTSIPTTNEPTNAPTTAQPTTPPTTAQPTNEPTRSPLVPTVIEPRPLEDVGNNGSPAEMFPLDACHGDCDSDSECQDGLVCFQRGGLQSVPGCLGEGTSGKDYCFDPLTTPSPVASTARPTRSPLVPTVIEPRPLEDVGNNGSPAEMFPLDACHGDCDSDSECQDGLVCFQRGGLQSVPGCLGEGTSGKDYCFDPLTTPSPTRIPTSIPTTNEPTNAPTTAQPTNAPTTAQPTNEPTNAPTTAQPTNAPTTAQPTSSPVASTARPTTRAPTFSPTALVPTSLPIPGQSRDLPTSGGQITLAASVNIGHITTLTKVIRRNVGEQVIVDDIIPLARTYDVNNEWSNAAGEAAAILIPNGWNCTKQTTTFCHAELPPLDDPEHEAYVLKTYEHSLSKRNEVSRFLEKVTFGVQTANLDHPRWDDASSLGSKFSQWMIEQMNMPQTSHRETYRRRANAPVPGSTHIGLVMDACTSISRWRKLSYGDPEWGDKIVEHIPNTTLYKIKIGGQIRSVLDEAFIGASSNPIVNFTGWNELDNLQVVDLPEQGEHLIEFGSGYITTAPLSTLPVGGLCGNLNGVSRLEAWSEFGAIVGRIANTGEWLLLDGLVDFKDNDIMNPLPDGGGAAVSISRRKVTSGENGDHSSEYNAAVTKCSNVPRTFLNSEGCVLSALPDVCREDSFVVDGTAHSSASEGILVCGSPGEVSNDPTYSQSESFELDPDLLRTTNRQWTTNGRRTTWTHVSITAEDQFRQRVAFALSQIIPFVPSTITGGISECFVNYHDIFVRNAFGSYRDILKEVSYSPIMAKTLTYLKSKSMSFVKYSLNQFSLADENYAREVMQLFTMGDVLLNQDGTPLRHPETGVKQEVYTESHIMSFARAWTGFDLQPNRGNVEDDRQGHVNNIDPMRIIPDWRDKFPKISLGGGYIGDRYPVCDQLPPQMFLKAGATYRFLGSSKLPEMVQAKQEYLEDDTLVEFSLDASSQLKLVLCEGAGDDCLSQPPQNEVTLSSSLSCLSSTSECLVDTVRVVKVAENRYWEYLPPACVEQAFYENGKKMKTKHGMPRPLEIVGNGWSPAEMFPLDKCHGDCDRDSDCQDGLVCFQRNGFEEVPGCSGEGTSGKDYCYDTNIRPNSAVCGNTRLATAFEACCEVFPLPGSNLTGQVTMHNLYDDERVTYATAAARCDAQLDNTSLCDFNPELLAIPIHKSGYHWTDVDCQVLVKVLSDDGWIGIVHDTQGSTPVQHVDNETENYFPAFWDNESYPTKDDMCGGTESSCEVIEEGCLCAVSVSELAGFTTMPESVGEVIGKLFIGALPPEESMYHQTKDESTGITAHMKDAGVMDEETIFEVVDGRTGRVFYLKNIISTVNVAGTSYSFRNAPHFMSLVPSEANIKDAQDETEAVLDDYFFHKNTPPFLARLLIQRFNIASNPVPSHVATVASAFESGTFSFEGTNFGTGRYGDLGATVAAAFLSPDALSPTVDADPSSGSIRQPLLKAISVLRNQELGSQDLAKQHEYPVTQLHRVGPALHKYIGQGAMQYQNIFSHFSADNPAGGRGMAAGLLAPEESVLDFPRIVNILNNFFGTFSTEGFNSRGFGAGWSGKLYWNPKGTSAAEVVDEIATLMSPGRLSQENRQLLENVYASTLDTSGAEEAKILTLQLMATTPEFQVTNQVIIKSGKDRASEKIAKMENNGCAQPSESPGIGDALVERWDDIGSIADLVASPDFPASPSNFMITNGQLELQNLSGKFSYRIATYITAPTSGDYTFWVSADDAMDLYLSTDTCQDKKVLIASQSSWSSPYDWTKFTSQKSELVKLVAGRTYYMEGLYANGGNAGHFAIAWATPGTASVPEVIPGQYFSLLPPIPQVTIDPDYKAIIYLDLGGGVDSYNMLVPQSCEGSEASSSRRGYYNKTVDEQYYIIRGGIALDRNNLHQIESNNVDQPCTVFGVHPRLETLATLYNEGDALFAAQVGYLSSPSESEGQSGSHYSMSNHAARVDPFNEGLGLGVMGRMRDELIRAGHKTSAINVGGKPLPLEGKPGFSEGPIAVSDEGISEFPNEFVFDPSSSFTSRVEFLNNDTTPDSGFMAEQWSSKLHNSLSAIEELKLLEDVSTLTPFPTVFDKASNPLAEQLKLISRLQQTAAQRGVTRDLYSAEYSSFDHHGGVIGPLDFMFGQLDDALAVYAAELKALGLWSSTTIVEVSEFGRTLYPNGNLGSDHGWAGHYFIAGGAVKGNKVIGKFPSDMWSLSGSRPKPSFPWESLWNGIGKWAGVEDMTQVCPNLSVFEGTSLLFDSAEMFN